MASTNKCEYCGATITSDDRVCPNCGAGNPLYVEDKPRVILAPHTIEELQEYCAERGMPLARMRFFIGQDIKEPRAFGIYRDEATGSFVVYKNKDTGDRAIRYSGPDEEHAVTEIYLKLLDECHKRNIWPDTIDGQPPKELVKSREEVKKKSILDKLTSFGFVVAVIALIVAFATIPRRLLGSIGIGFIGFIAALILVGIIVELILPDKKCSKETNRKKGISVVIAAVIIAILFGALKYNRPSGYYNVDGVYYYRTGLDNYFFSPSSSSWYEYDGSLSSDYYLGEDYSYVDSGLSSWDSFEESDYYSGSSSSSDSDYYSDSSYDSWDSSSTDWGSDW